MMEDLSLTTSKRWQNYYKLELIATLISRLQGPAYGLVNVLNANARNLCTH